MPLQLVGTLGSQRLRHIAGVTKLLSKVAERGFETGFIWFPASPRLPLSLDFKGLISNLASHS